MQASFEDKNTPESEAREEEFKQYYEKAYPYVELMHNGRFHELDFTAVDTSWVEEKNKENNKVECYIELKGQKTRPQRVQAFNQGKFTKMQQLWDYQKITSKVYFRYFEQDDPGIYWLWEPYTGRGWKKAFQGHWMQGNGIIYFPLEDLEQVNFNTLIEQQERLYGI